MAFRVINSNHLPHNECKQGGAMPSEYASVVLMRQSLSCIVNILGLLPLRVKAESEFRKG